MAWQFVGVSSVATVTTASHALSEPAGVQQGDLLVAVISSRIASTTAITLPSGGEWTLVTQQLNNNTLTTSSALPSGMMAYCKRGASAPNLTFTHPTTPSVAMGRIVAYRGLDPVGLKDTQSSFTTATNTTAVSGAGLTTASPNELIVVGCCGGQEAAWSAHNATDPGTSSGTNSVQTADPIVGTWQERQDSNTTTGADTSLAICDAVKGTAGATGNLTATASVNAGHVVVAGAFVYTRSPNLIPLQDDLAISEFAPTVGLTDHRNISPPQGSLSGGGSNPTVQLGKILTIPQGNLSDSSVAPTVAASQPSPDIWAATGGGAAYTLSNNNHTASISADGEADVVSQKARSSADGNRFYFQVTVDAFGGWSSFGLSDLSGHYALWNGATGDYGADINSQTGLFPTFTTGDVLEGFADFDHNKLWMRKNGGNWNNDVLANQNPATNTGGKTISTSTSWKVCYILYYASDSATCNFGDTAFAHSVPVGGLSWDDSGTEVFISDTMLRSDSNNGSMRAICTIDHDSQGSIRLTWACLPNASSGYGSIITHMSFGKWDGNTGSADTTTTPIEIKFGGASGFDLSWAPWDEEGRITSDWVDHPGFTLSAGDAIVIIWDTPVLDNYHHAQESTTGASSNNVTWLSLSGTAESWNAQTITPADYAKLSEGFCIKEIDTKAPASADINITVPQGNLTKSSETPIVVSGASPNITVPQGNLSDLHLGELFSRRNLSGADNAKQGYNLRQVIDASLLGS